ncbi:MAG: potassium transporter TrkG, partial [Cucumibacter sp.]
FLATFFGGCAGSPTGGLQTYRLIVMYETARTSLKELIYPNGVFVVRYDGAVVSDETIRSMAVFLAAFFTVFLIGSAGLSLLGLDFVSALSGTLTALTNTGPGLGSIIGPAGNFSSLPEAAKWLLSLVMLLGRLEILTVLVLLNPAFWRS